MPSTQSNKEALPCFHPLEEVSEAGPLYWKGQKFFSFHPLEEVSEGKQGHTSYQKAELFPSLRGSFGSALYRATPLVAAAVSIP